MKKTLLYKVYMHTQFKTRKLPVKNTPSKVMCHVTHFYQTCYTMTVSQAWLAFFLNNKLLLSRIVTTKCIKCNGSIQDYKANNFCMCVCRLKSNAVRNFNIFCNVYVSCLRYWFKNILAKLIGVSGWM